MSIKNIFLTGFAVIVFSSFAIAQDGQPGNQAGKGGEQRTGRMERGRRMNGEGRSPGMMRGGMRINFERLNLTDAQKQRIQAIQDSAGSAREANRTQFEEFGKLTRLKREGLLTTDQGTRLNALQVQMRTRMQTDMERMRNDILAVLTADQKALLEQGRGDRNGDRGNGMRRPGERNGQGRRGAPAQNAGSPPSTVN